LVLSGTQVFYILIKKCEPDIFGIIKEDQINWDSLFRVCLRFSLLDQSLPEIIEEQKTNREYLAGDIFRLLVNIGKMLTSPKLRIKPFP
jgi:hypothetical protein